LTEFLLGAILSTVLPLGHIAPDIQLLGAFVIFAGETFFLGQITE
jgi:hypothetical protein